MLNLREIYFYMDLVFVGLKMTSQVAAHCVILSRSVLIQAAAVTDSSTVIKNGVAIAS